MYISNDTKQYQKYFDAYKSLSVNIAKLLIRENKGNETELNDSYLNDAWEKLLQLETKIAKVWIHIRGKLGLGMFKQNAEFQMIHYTF